MRNGANVGSIAVPSLGRVSKNTRLICHFLSTVGLHGHLSQTTRLRAGRLGFGSPPDHGRDLFSGAQSASCPMGTEE